ncbi:MAG: hypothetical protein WD021_07545 [Rhodothermales bacterium]
MNDAHRLLALTALAAGLHSTLGWEWTAAAGLAAGYWMPQRAWIYGGVVVGLDYALFVAFSFARDPRAVGVMTETMGAFLGNMPSYAVVALTVVLGVAIGIVTGAAGRRLRHLVDRPLGR